MQLSNIRTNFTEMDETAQRQFFFEYAEKRSRDFEHYELKVIKVKKTSSKEPKLKVTPAQLALLKTLGLV